MFRIAEVLYGMKFPRILVGPDIEAQLIENRIRSLGTNCENLIAHPQFISVFIHHYLYHWQLVARQEVLSRRAVDNLSINIEFVRREDKLIWIPLVSDLRTDHRTGMQEQIGIRPRDVVLQRQFFFQENHSQYFCHTVLLML